MMKPTLHRGGTAREDLFQAYKNAYEKVCEAMDALSATTPHERDYYPQGDDAIVRASAEHAKRIRQLKQIAEDIETLACHTMGD